MDPTLFLEDDDKIVETRRIHEPSRFLIILVILIV